MVRLGSSDVDAFWLQGSPRGPGPTVESRPGGPRGQEEQGQEGQAADGLGGRPRQVGAPERNEGEKARARAAPRGARPRPCGARAARGGASRAPGGRTRCRDGRCPRARARATHRRGPRPRAPHRARGRDHLARSPSLVLRGPGRPDPLPRRVRRHGRAPRQRRRRHRRGPRGGPRGASHPHRRARPREPARHRPRGRALLEPRDAVTQTACELTLGEETIRIETGEVARQAGGAVLLRHRDTILFAAATASANPTRLPYMPLTVDYRHRLAAAGRIPGSYERREAKATTPEVLVSRVVDRSVRPFFPAGWRYDTQVILQPLSYDPRSDLEALAVIAASAALNLSDVPFRVPLAAVRIVAAGEGLLVFPEPSRRSAARLEALVSTSDEGIVMVEGGGREAPEEEVLEALALAHRATESAREAIASLREAAGKPARSFALPARDEALRARVDQLARSALTDALAGASKQERAAATGAAWERVRAEALGAEPEAEVEAEAREAFESAKKELIRERLLAGQRLDGRAPDEVRSISGRSGWLPSCHGSSLFTRGETQVVATCTLGDGRSAQRLESLDGERTERFLLHYDFPPYCVGEVRPLRAPGRRELGHGALARRALESVLPPLEDFPFTLRLQSTVTESNGSSSMATVCGGSMALFDAGVPLRAPVAGIAMGLVCEGERAVVLSDILGDEDHAGDMDFKVAGTHAGITAIQLDNKLGALPLDLMREGLERARAGRLHILGRMSEVIAAPAEPRPHVPRAATRRIEPARIRDLIGAGGRTINGIRGATGVEIDVDDAGLVFLFAPPGADLEGALSRIDDVAGLPRLGETYTGRVVAVKPFGAFVRLFQGVEGLLPGVATSPGAELRVRVAGVNPKGKLELQQA
ncbi:MAG: polyribonucleotide nucleotidyltransferase [Planctomycetota bacterium]|nr:MAG: polyribonucleotide nucleotidyltransferase [Planctomycetota bacterium]